MPAVGETAGGEPIFEVRSVRLVLDGDATHFDRTMVCSKRGLSTDRRATIPLRREPRG